MFDFDQSKKYKKDQDNKYQHLVTAFKKGFIALLIFCVRPYNGNNKSYKKHDGKNYLSFGKHLLLIRFAKVQF